MLRHRTPEDIQKYLQTMADEARGIIDRVVHMIYFMRGSVSYTEAMHMSWAERQLVEEFIEKRLETESKNPHPQY